LQQGQSRPYAMEAGAAGGSGSPHARNSRGDGYSHLQKGTKESVRIMGDR
jgi:hypothetical protein